MKMAAALCYDCGSAYDSLDNYCRSCGASLRVRRLPALVTGRRIARVEPRILSNAVGRGVAALLVARTLSWAVRLLVRRMTAASPARQLALRPAAEPQTEQARSGPEGGYTMASVTVSHLYAGPPAEATRPAHRRRWPLLFR